MFSLGRVGLGKQIQYHRLKKGWTLQHLAELADVDVGTIHAIEARDSSRSKYFPNLARALGVTLEELSGEARGAIVGEPLATYGMAPILAWEHAEDLPPGEFIMVPRLDIHLSAGEGREQVEIELTKQSPQAFRTEWIRGQRLKPNKLAAMTASGNSMEPTIHDGDSLLVDTSDVSVTDGRVYALWYDGGERVKRLFRLPGGGLRIKSDNPEHGTIELAAEYGGIVRVIGRVVHRSGVGGL